MHKCAAHRALEILRSCINNDGQLTIRPEAAQAFPTDKAEHAVSILKHVDEVLAQGNAEHHLWCRASGGKGGPCDWLNDRCDHVSPNDESECTLNAHHRGPCRNSTGSVWWGTA